MRRLYLRKRVSRRAWKAKPPRCAVELVPGEVRGVKVHYSGALADARADHRECAEVFRRWQRMHTGPGGLGVEKGGCDVGYSHGICPHGFTFVGRGFRRRPGANGTAECNRRYLAVVVFGGDKAGRRDVTAAQRNALVRYVERLRTIYPAAREVGAHSDCRRTACPGDELRALIQKLFPSRKEIRR